jgi:anti-sigma B factor antagonist
VTKRAEKPSAPFVAIRENLANAEVLHVFGSVDIATAPDFEESINAIDSGLPVIVDLSECSYIDTTALSVLIRAFRRSGGSRHFRVVVGSESQVERVFTIVQMNTIMPVRNSVEESLAV